MIEQEETNIYETKNILTSNIYWATKAYMDEMTL